MIRYIEINNFKSLVNTKTELGNLNVFIGNNGAGKSSFFRSLSFLRDLVANDSINTALERQGAKFNDLVTLRASEKSIKFKARVTTQAIRGDDAPADIDAYVSISVKKRRFLYVEEEEVTPWDKRGALVDHEGDINKLPYIIYRFRRRMIATEQNSRPMTIENMALAHSFLRDVYSAFVRSRGKRFPLLGSIARSMIRFRHYEIWGPEALRMPSRLGASTLKPDGSNMAASLYRMRATGREAFDSLIEYMQKAYPWLHDIEFKQIAHKDYMLSFIEKPSLNAGSKSKKYSADQVSDGFLRMLALATLRYSPVNVQTIAYEEPENGLHPRMITRAGKLLREISESGVQVLVSTHSPQLISAIFDDIPAEQIKDELKLVQRNSAGETSISSPSLKVLESSVSQHISIGDLWSMLLGEKDLQERP